MINYNEEIDRVKESLEILFKEFNSSLNGPKIGHKSEQLKSVQRSISILEKTNTPIPEELRSLKLSLLNEIGIYNESKEAKDKLVLILNQYLPKGSIKISKPSIIRKIREKSGPRIKLYELIKANLIHPNTQIEGSQNGKIYTAKISVSGEVVISKDGKIEKYGTPSGAAKALLGREADGWVWWRLSGKSKELTLDYFRKKYMNNET